MASLLGGMMGVVLTLLARNARDMVPGLQQWAQATVLIFVSAVLFALREWVPAALVVILSNTLLVGGLLLYLKGSGLYFQVPFKWTGWLLWYGLCLAGVGYFSHIEPSLRWRTVFILPATGAIMGAHAWLFFRQPGSSLGQRFILLALSAMTLVIALRWVHALVWMTDQDNLQTVQGLQLVFISLHTLLLLLLTVGFVLLASERMREVFQFQAAHDALTGAFNRRVVMERMTQELARSQRYQGAFSVLILDIDHFKHINDSHGHQVGDEVLKRFVGHIAAMLRPNDTLGRLGGEEFMVLLPETGPAAAQTTAQRIVSSLAEAPAWPVCTVSIGVTSWLAQDRTVDEIVARADAALYTAKRNGRNRVECA